VLCTVALAQGGMPFASWHTCLSVESLCRQQGSIVSTLELPLSVASNQQHAHLHVYLLCTRC